MTDIYALGIDCSTQGMKAVVVDADENKIKGEVSLNYSKDERLNKYGIDFTEYIVPPREDGEAEQPPMMYIEGIDALMADLKKSGLDMKKIKVISFSAQQHGHVYLNEKSESKLNYLNEEDSENQDLSNILKDIFSYKLSPIWETSNTEKEAGFIRDFVGGSENMIALSGSNSPKKFTGAMIRRIGIRYPDLYAGTHKMLLTNSFLAAVLTGNVNVPIDFGNGCGMSLMNYKNKIWSNKLVEAVSYDLPGGTEKLKKMLPDICPPDSIVGKVCSYFHKKYEINKDCLIAAGSGDNPQTKVLVEGDLLSIGTSIVIMVSIDDDKKLNGEALGMYDGIGRPFVFGGRHNGALIWDQLLKNYDIDDKEKNIRSKLLESAVPGKKIFIWQPHSDEFPVTKQIKKTRINYDEINVENDYSALVDFSLGIVYQYSKNFYKDPSEPIFLTGGASKNIEILKRVASIWNREVIPIGAVGAALGAAISGLVAYNHKNKNRIDKEEIIKKFVERGDAVKPEEMKVRNYKKYLPELAKEYKKIVEK